MAENNKPRAVCMIAYANYFTDARIKSYVAMLLNNGFRVDVFALGKSEATQPGLRVFSLASKVWSAGVLPYILAQVIFLLAVFYRVSLEFARERYVVIHVHNMPDFLVLGAVIPKIFGSRIILDIHDTMPEAYATKYDLPLSHPLIRVLCLEERWSSALADRVITTNDLHKEALIEHGIPRGKITIIMNLGNPAIFVPYPHRSRSGGLRLGYHGTIAERLGLDLILEAVDRARQECPELSLDLIGDGESMPEVRRIIAARALQDTVRLRGWVPVEDLPTYLAHIDVGIVGNRSWWEKSNNWGLPVKMLEYAAMEIPSICPRLRVIRRYFDENAAFYYEPDDAEDMARRILELYRQPAKIDAARAHLRAFNEKYNWADAEREYLGIVGDLAVSG